ncbi:helix-turn-helix domain-containing protein [Alterisphingorhabdus coralli]|uniref:Helix-turn-helix domain-containing protein n=1 Tax=Alterisphingorhabdus coralli TaxID=3071408 RepID=A0AA97F7T7_9SPHN|nr:helix-turn-helix domain-containing protein [Parasphingorhabdus sp. SCSIO 66989]WOE74667.1 helix-turn-helix domain-containing protein [Parasphingorhabdus sp. SCSIO 66989]
MLLESNVSYEVPAQPFSALYIPLSDELLFTVGEEKVAATVDDIMAIPRGTAHSLRLPGARPTRRGRLEPPFETTPQKSGTLSRLFCCRVPTTANPLPDIVPDIIHYKPERQRECGRLDLLLSLIRHHALNASTNRQAKLRRLAEVAAGIFLEGVISDYESAGLSMANAASDPQIRRAINKIHENPEALLSLQDLATTAGLSRSSFSERFRTATGKSPMAYVSDHRLGLAARLLSKDQITVSQAAVAVGYETDSAFAKAFRKRYGVSPAVYRRRAEP